MLPYISSVNFQGSLSSPSTLQNLRSLNATVSEAGERYATLKVATIYSEISSQAWDLQGVFADLQTSQHLRKFYEQQTLFLSSYGTVLDTIRNTLQNCVGQFYDASQIIPGKFEASHLVKENIRQYLEVLVNSLNTYDGNYGYIFSGAQTDQKPVNPQLITDTRNPSLTFLTLGEVKDYFLNGRTPEAQSPLAFYAEGQQVYTLPVRAIDLEPAVRILYEFLQLPANPTDEELGYFRQALDQSFNLITTGITKISGYQNTCEQRMDLFDRTSSAYASWRDEQLMLDPMEAALDFEESSRSLQAFLSYITFLVSVSKTFNDITNRLMI